MSVSRGVEGPLVVRGIRVGGGAGQVMFSAKPADAREAGEVRHSSSGDRIFYFAVTQEAKAGVSNISDGFYLYPSTAGCYTIQVDGPDFREVIVIEAK